MVREVWVVGIYDTLLRRGVIEYVEFRDAATLTELVRKYVAPGTTVYTNQWRGYSRLRAAGYDHNTVNHSENFVDPTTGVCTNAVEAEEMAPTARCDEQRLITHTYR